MQNSMSIKIQFLLPNQQHIATKSFDKSISICQIFEDIHLEYDFFDEELFHLEWSVYSSATNRYIGYETITLQEILPDYQEDTFVFLDCNFYFAIQQIQLVLNYHIGFKEHLIMIIQLKISLMNKYINYKIPYLKVVFRKLAKIIINLLMNIQVPQKQIYQMNNLYQEQCCKSALQIYNLLIQINPTNSLAHLNKGKALNKIGEHTKALDCLNTAISLNHQLQSAYDEERSIAQQQLARQQQQKEQQQNQQQQ
ncbi:unnamed protein product [Paramecium primaurelia]|uniref:Tetratricopeptide repeat protein n=1 Tax=Paramecium primaurelia TaxID=5886 RepID=A0A8S1QJ06_PARPR|nr:unnamed protein product [Paramecium primaurelia]